MIKLGSCFTGIGAWEKAFTNLKINYELQWYFEIDKYASCSYCGVHEEDESKNKWDITKANPKQLEDIDVLVYSPPCQAFSVAGKQEGLKDPRGMMFYHTLPIIKEKSPKICMMENVKGLVTGKFKELFKDMLTQLENLGYNNYYKVLNSKDYGIPQNRERVFIISIRKDIDKHVFEFPKPFDNGLRLKDLLEDEVDEKYYISQEKCDKLISHLKNNQFEPNILKYERTKYGKKIRKEYESGNIKEKIGNMRELTPRTDGITNTLTTVLKDNILCIPCITPDRINKRQNGRRFKEDGEPSFTLTAQDRHGIVLNDSVRLGGIFDNEKSKHQAGSVWDKNGFSPTLDTMQGVYRQPSTILNNFRIRKLTPKECWRLQGFSDEDFEKAKEALNNKFYKGKDRSNSQLYKQAGNSITVKVLEEIYKNIFLQK